MSTVVPVTTVVSDPVVTEAQSLPPPVITEATITTIISEVQADEPLVPGNTGSTRGEATDKAEDQIEGEGSSGRTLKSSEEKRKEKGKGVLSFAEELAEIQRKKEEKRKRRGEGADTLRLKADSRMMNPLGLVLSDADREAAMKAQLEYDQREQLAEIIAKEEADQVNAADALQAQREEMENLKQAALEKKEEVEWFNRRINSRQNNSRIIDATIHPPRAQRSPLLITLKRADTINKSYKLEWLEVLGISEWFELGTHISKSKNKLKEKVIDALQRLFVRLVRIQQENKITVSQERSELLHLLHRLLKGQPIKHPKNKKKGPFATLHDQGYKIDSSGIDLSIPTKAAQPEQTIINEPEFGIFFEDIFGSIGFFRIRDIQNASSSFLRAMLGVPRYSEDGNLIVQLITRELSEREPHNPDPSSF